MLAASGRVRKQQPSQEQNICCSPSCHRLEQRDLQSRLPAEAAVPHRYPGAYPPLDLHKVGDILLQKHHNQHWLCLICCTQRHGSEISVRLSLQCDETAL